MITIEPLDDALKTDEDMKNEEFDLEE